MVLMIASLSALIWGVGTSLTTILYGSSMTAPLDVGGKELELVMAFGMIKDGYCKEEGEEQREKQ